MDIMSVLQLFGGLGLFLYGMSLMCSSIEKIAGSGSGEGAENSPGDREESHSENGADGDGAAHVREDEAAGEHTDQDRKGREDEDGHRNGPDFRPRSGVHRHGKTHHRRVDGGGDAAQDDALEAAEVQVLRLAADPVDEHLAAHVQQQEEADDVGHLLKMADIFRNQFRRARTQAPAGHEKARLDDGEDGGDGPHLAADLLAGDGHAGAERHREAVGAEGNAQQDGA